MIKIKLIKLNYILKLSSMPRLQIFSNCKYHNLVI